MPGAAETEAAAVAKVKITENLIAVRVKTRCRCKVVPQVNMRLFMSTGHMALVSSLDE